MEQVTVTPRDDFMEAARREMVKFERREIEFRKNDRSERAAELRIPVLKRKND
jgi:hypothetical protein